jgi:hypothetical protein
MHRYLLSALLLLATLIPVAPEPGPFNSSALLDASQVVTHPGVWMCPQGRQDEVGNCTVDLIPVVPNRPDWDEALSACMQYYAPNDCYNSVTNGEF